MISAVQKNSHINNISIFQQKAKQISEDERKKYEEQYGEYAKKLETQKEEYQKENPEKFKKPEEKVDRSRLLEIVYSPVYIMLLSVDICSSMDLSRLLAHRLLFFTKRLFSYFVLFSISIF